MNEQFKQYIREGVWGRPFYDHETENRLLKRELCQTMFENELNNVDYVPYILECYKVNGDSFDWISKQDLLEICPRFSTMKELDPVIETLTGKGYLTFDDDGYSINWKLMSQWVTERKAMGADSILGIGDDIE